MNDFRLAGQLLELAPLRHTPAGIPVASGVIAHTSEQLEAGKPRQVRLELEWLAIGEIAERFRGVMPGMDVSVSGFLAAKSLRSKWPVLHLNKIEFLEGNKNGFQAQDQA